MAKLGINTGLLPNDGTGDSLIEGAVKINSNFSEIYSYFGDGSSLNFTDSTWEKTTFGISTSSNVGIGTTLSRFFLEIGSVGSSGTSLYVNGNARVTGILTVGSSNNIILNGNTNVANFGPNVTINGSTGNITAASLVVGGTNITGSAVTFITAGYGISLSQNTGNVTISSINEWIKTSSGIHTLSNVGVGTTNPTSTLTVSGLTSTSDLYVTGISSFNGNSTFIGTVFFPADDLSSNRIEPNNDLFVLGGLQLDGAGGNAIISSPGTLVLNSGFNDSLVIIQGGTTYYESGSDLSVNLYYDSDKKIQTTGYGATVYGDITSDNLLISGIVTASSFVGDGSSLTNLPIPNSGIEIQDSGSTIGIATIIDFGSNISVSSVSSGIVTVSSTSSGGSGETYWSSTASGIHTLSNVGVGTTNPTSSLTVDGDARITGILTIGTSSITLDGSSNNINVGSGVTIYGDSGTVSASSFEINGESLTGLGVTSITAGVGISITQSTGNVTISATDIGTETYWASTASGIHTLSNVGVGTTNPQAPLQVERYAISTKIESFNASVGIKTNIDTVSNQILSAEYTLHFMHNSGIQAQKVLVMHDGTTAYSQEYAIMSSSNPIVSVGSSIFNGNLVLNIVPEDGITGIITYRFSRQTLV